MIRTKTALRSLFSLLAGTYLNIHLIKGFYASIEGFHVCKILHGNLFYFNIACGKKFNYNVFRYLDV